MVLISVRVVPNNAATLILPAMVFDRLHCQHSVAASREEEREGMDGVGGVRKEVKLLPGNFMPVQLFQTRRWL